jgi:hypothetical protein
MSNSTFLENTHVEHDTDLPGAELYRGGDRDRMDPFAHSAGRADFSLFDAGLFGDFEHDLSLDGLVSEDDQSLSFNSDQEPHHAEEGDFPKPSRRRRPKALSRLTEEDFEPGAERSAFSIIDHHAHCLFKPKAKPQDITAAIAFFFTVTDDGGITFKSCCDVLRAREDVLRLRIQYEWWLRGTIFTGPFPFMAVPVPRDVASEIVYYSGNAGYALAREAFVQPGIEQAELLEVVSTAERSNPSQLKIALDHLEERFLMSSQAGRWWTTGRNPMLMLMRLATLKSSIAVHRGGSIHWSRLFGTGNK